MIFDNFLDSYDELKEYSLTCTYSDERNPVDEVTYPLICKDIPSGVSMEILRKLEEIKGAPLDDYVIFMRQSPLGVNCPHPVHNDSSMGRWSFMLYLNDNPDGGTGLFRHRESGIAYAPENPEYVDILKRDQSDITKWVEYGRIPMKQNRAVIFDASMMHAALPFGGYGSGDGARTVLTVFFT